VALHLIAEIREYLGAHKRILSALHRMENSMATATEQLTTLNSKVDDLIGDVRAALAVINNDELSEPAQAALDSLTAKVEAFDGEVGDADGSDTPTEPTA
jgi:uncharacterized protein with PIN domain